MSVLWVPGILVAVGVLLRGGARDAPLSRTKVTVAIAALLVQLIGLSPHWLFVADEVRPLGVDSLSVVASFALALALVVVTVVCAVRAHTSTNALAISYWVSAAAVLVIVGTDIAWLFVAYGLLGLVVYRSAPPERGAPPRTRWLRHGRFPLFAVGLVGAGILAFGFSTRFAELAEIGSRDLSASGASLLGFAVNAVLLVAILLWVSVEASAWRSPAPLVVRAAISFASSMAVYVSLVRFMGWLADLGAFGSGASLVRALGILVTGVGALRAYRFVEPSRFLASLTMAHVGVAMIAVTAGVAGRAAGMYLLLSAYAAILGLAIARDLGAATEEQPFGVSSPTCWLTRLSLASLATVPPFPGFVAKLLTLEALFGDGGTMAFLVLLASIAVVAIACLHRALSCEERKRTSESRRRLHWITATLGLAITLVLGVFPDGALAVVSVAVAGFF